MYVIHYWNIKENFPWFIITWLEFMHRIQLHIYYFILLHWRKSTNCDNQSNLQALLNITLNGTSQKWLVFIEFWDGLSNTIEFWVIGNTQYFSLWWGNYVWWTIFYVLYMFLTIRSCGVVSVSIFQLSIRWRW